MKINHLLKFLLALFITSCSLLPHREEVRTTLGIRTFSNLLLTQAQMNEIDQCYHWAVNHGLKVNPSDLKVSVVEGILTPGGNYGLPNGENGYHAGRVVAKNSIQLIIQNLDNLRHELTHIIATQEGWIGHKPEDRYREDLDKIIHSDPRWKAWGVW